jgi:beta-glucosidase/6-phospho-beta-glucosidase/beta-galactosidase
MVQVVLGMIETIEAVRAVDPNAVMVQVEACALHRAAHDDLAALVDEEYARRFVSYDLLDGRIDPSHPLFTWLVRNGTRPGVLREIAARKARIDVLGLNFYPQWSTHQLYLTRRGRVGSRSSERDGAGFAELIERYHERYGLPVMVTETSAFGPDDVRSRWLAASVATVKELRGRGVPVVGYTWFPLFTMIDWRYRFGRGPADAYRVELGLYVLGTGERRWEPTPLVAQFARYAADSSASIGPVVEPAQPRIASS